MLLVAKILMLALFVVTGGAVFTKWGRRHKLSVFVAGAVAIIGSSYLARDIARDFHLAPTKEELASREAEATRRKSISDMRDAMAAILTGNRHNDRVSVLDPENCVALVDFLDGQRTVYFNKIRSMKIKQRQRAQYVVASEGTGILRFKDNSGGPLSLHNNVEFPLNPDACPDTRGNAIDYFSELKILLEEHCKATMANLPGGVVRVSARQR
jgi:hypothetical protein